MGRLLKIWGLLCHNFISELLNQLAVLESHRNVTVNTNKVKFEGNPEINQLNELQILWFEKADPLSV